MKTLTITLGLTLLLMLACKKDGRVLDTSTIEQTTPVKSINGFKDGKPFINYLGVKMDGC